MINLRTLASAAALIVMLTVGATQARADSDGLFGPNGKVVAAREVAPVGQTRPQLTEANEPLKQYVIADAASDANAAANAAAVAANATANAAAADAAATAAAAAVAAAANANAAAAAANATANAAAAAASATANAAAADAAKAASAAASAASPPPPPPPPTRAFR